MGRRSKRTRGENTLSSERKGKTAVVIFPKPVATRTPLPGICYLCPIKPPHEDA